MRRGLLYAFFLLVVILSGYFGYLVRGAVTEEKAAAEKPETQQPESAENLIMKKNVMSYIDGIPRAETEAIVKNGEVFVPARYIANAMGIPFEYQSEGNVLHLGKSISERVYQEKFFIRDQASYLNDLTTPEQAEAILGKPMSSEKRFNECTSLEEITAVYDDAEILFIFDGQEYRLSDITVMSDSITTEKGISIGATPEDIRAAYGDLVAFPGYVEEIVSEGFSGNGLVRYGLKESLWFELKDGHIVRFGKKMPHC